jgi:hypothetical protein
MNFESMLKQLSDWDLLGLHTWASHRAWVKPVNPIFAEVKDLIEAEMQFRYADWENHERPMGDEGHYKSEPPFAYILGIRKPEEDFDIPF